MDVFLPRNTCGFCQSFTFCDANLALHNVDAGHFFGHRMFNLHTRVHFDEEKLLAVHIHQEFDSARAFIPHMRANPAAQIAHLGTLGIGQIGGRGPFNHLLVAALHGAIAFIKVIDIAMAIAQNLHFHMARAQDHLFKITLTIAKSGLRLPPTFAHFVGKFIRPVDRPHTAPATAPRRLEHQRIAHFSRLFLDQFHIIAKHFGGWNDGNPRRHCHAPRRCFVAKCAHCRGFGADKSNTRCIAGFDKIGVFRQQTVARVNSICTRGQRHANDLRDT